MLTNSSINQTDPITSMIKHNLHKACIIILMSPRIDRSDCFFISFDAHFLWSLFFTDTRVINRLASTKKNS